MKEENRRVENGVTYVDVIETTTFIEKTIVYPFGLQRVVRIKQAEPKPAPENAQAGQIVIPKKKGIIALIVAVVLGALGIKAFNATKQDEYDGFDTDADDIDDVYDEDDQDDSEE